MARRDNVSIKIDYISIVFDSAMAEEVIKRVLGLPVDLFLKGIGKIKHKPYQSVYRAGSIQVFGDSKITEENPAGLGSYLVLTGMGCDEIFRILYIHGHTFGDLFWKCERWFGSEFHLTRIDIAIDGRNEVPYFTPEQIKRKCEKEEFIGNSNSYRFVESSFTEKETAKTVYIGVGKSNLSYRFYDKDKEVIMKYQRSYEEIGGWKRTELQLRDEKAHAFAMLFKENPLELGKIAFDLLAVNLRFIISDKNQSNKSRWKTCQFWERFLGAVEPLQLHMDNPHNTLLETHQALGGLESVGEMLTDVNYSPSFGNKMIGHLCRIDREDLIPYVKDDTRKGGVC